MSMFHRGHLTFGIVIAIFSLSLAIAVYCLTRSNPPDLLAPLFASNGILDSFEGFLGSAPSFLYTLALGLILGVCASSRTGINLHCFIWIGLCMVLELTQLPAFSVKLSSLLPSLLPEPGWRLIGPYWQRGVFDPIDLLSTLAGGLIAIMLIHCLRAGERNVIH